MKNLKPVTVFWFRRDLRLHDNHGLYEALKSSNEVLPVFIFDKIILNRLSDKKDKRVSKNSHIDIQAPDFADPQIKKYYSNYTAYLKKVVTAIRNQDEAGTMKIFREEGKQWDNRNEMDQKAKTEEEQKFTTWLMQSYPYQTEIIKSDYYKKYTEEYYKKVKEDFDKKNN